MALINNIACVDRSEFFILPVLREVTRNLYEIDHYKYPILAMDLFPKKKYGFIVIASDLPADNGYRNGNSYSDLQAVKLISHIQKSSPNSRTPVIIVNNNAPSLDVQEAEHQAFIREGIDRYFQLLIRETVLLVQVYSLYLEIDFRHKQHL